MTNEAKHMEQGLEFDAQLTKRPENVTYGELSNMDEIKPCPFCGIYPQVKEWEVGGIKQIKIICDGDFCHVHPSVFGNKETMLNVWNTRASPNIKEVDFENMYKNTCNCEGDGGPCMQCANDFGWNEAIDHIKARYPKLYTEEI